MPPDNISIQYLLLKAFTSPIEIPTDKPTNNIAINLANAPG